MRELFEQYRSLIIVLLIAGLVYGVNVWFSKRIAGAKNAIMAQEDIPVPVKLETRSPNYGVPVIDPATDLLAPVNPQATSPQAYQRARAIPRQTTEQPHYEMPETQVILPQ